ncbi:hypothetical protein OSB04_030555 [Centaurea solstitialis]|uniref:Importin N-terminal domain-containing protein n=1 Tax=Centaurea solstitialis TaxID=347529 RepID=A0AA38SRC3_9ASTR|nr:hypothetical protein OSB04_030555 [Centaurea solstitialis]
MKRKSETIDGTEKPSSSPLELLRRVAEEDSVDETIRESAAAEFNDHIKSRWIAWSLVSPIPDDEKDQIKTLIVPLLLSPNSNSNSNILAHLRQSLGIIGAHDFPKLWPALLPGLTSSLETAIEADDFASVNRVLAALNSLLKKFLRGCRRRSPADTITLDLRYCFDNFSEPLLKTVQIISTKIIDSGGFELVSAQLLCFEMFYSLNFIDLPGFFVKPVDKWMNEFNKYLNAGNELQSAVFENIGLYIDKQDQSFQDYFQPFVEDVVHVLMATKPLSVTAIQFLTQVVGSRWFYRHHLLQQQITEKVVVPNLLLSDDEQDLFHKDYLEYIRRVVKNSRRKVTCQLLKGIIANSDYTEAIQRLIQNWLASFAQNPTANWKYKDCASHDVNSFPILKVSAMKFLSKFWFQVRGMDLVGDVVRLLGSDANVVHSYAAIFIKKHLICKGVSEALLPILPVLSKNLFDALGKRGSEENKYVMRCILCVGGISSPSDIISNTLVVILNWFSRGNPKHPDRLFEAFDYVVTQSYNLVPALDAWILPSVRMILDKRLTDLFPYALRLLARLVDYGTNQRRGFKEQEPASLGIRLPMWHDLVAPHIHNER